MLPGSKSFHCTAWSTSKVFLSLHTRVCHRTIISLIIVWPSAMFRLQLETRSCLQGWLLCKTPGHWTTSRPCCKMHICLRMKRYESITDGDYVMQFKCYYSPLEKVCAGFIADDERRHTAALKEGICLYGHQHQTTICLPVCSSSLSILTSPILEFPTHQSSPSPEHTGRQMDANTQSALLKLY